MSRVTSSVPAASELIAMADTGLATVLGNGTMEAYDTTGVSTTYLRFLLSVVEILIKLKYNKESLRLVFAELLGRLDYVERSRSFDGLNRQGTSQEDLAIHVLKETIKKCNVGQCEKRDQCPVLMLARALKGIEDTEKEEIVVLYARIRFMIDVITHGH